MTDYSNKPYFQPLEEIAGVIGVKTKSPDTTFFRNLINYYFCQMASNMRVSVVTKDRGTIPINFYGISTANCVDSETEFLTPTGWKKISDYSKGDKVLEIDKHTLEGKFKEPLAYINQKADELGYKVTPSDRTSMSMFMSPNHRVPYSVRKGLTNVVTAKEMCSKTRINIHSNFKLVSSTKLTLTDDEIRVQIAFCADGSLKPKYSNDRVRVKKPRKITRLHILLALTNIAYKTTNEGDYTAFWFTPPLQVKTLDWAWGSDSEQLKVIATESQYWDGSTDKRTGNLQFFTTIKSDADLMQYAYQATFNTVCSLCISDRRGRERELGGKTYTTKSIDYIVRQTSSKTKTLVKANVSREPMTDGRQYCFTTSTGLWLMRRNGYISITYNSGVGKGFSNFIMNQEVVAEFRKEFNEVTMPFISNFWLEKLAKKLSTANGTDFDVELENINKEYSDLGEMMFSFDSGSVAGLKQLRQKFLMAHIGALSFIADEIGSNLTEPGVMDLVKAFLELYDMGVIGDKLLKNGKDAKRVRHLSGTTPANMMLYGTPTKLYDGSVVEKLYRQVLSTGMARRSFFAHSEPSPRDMTMTPEEVYNISIAVSKSGVLEKYNKRFKHLANKSNYRADITFSKECSLELIEYEQYCFRQSANCKSTEDDKKAELDHSYFKVLKLSAAYAFIDGEKEVQLHHLFSAIRCGLDSTEVFNKFVINQPRPYTRLLNYLCKLSKGYEVTYADLSKDLAFFPSAKSARIDMLTLAAADGYKNNISLISRTENDVELFSVKQLEPTNLEELIVSYSDKVSRDYVNVVLSWEDLPALLTSADIHWVSHHTNKGVRNEANIIEGFNLVVLDIDKYVDIETVKLTLADYSYITHTTKRHTDKEHRFRIVLPLSHEVELDGDEFNKFMQNIFDWLPFDCDTATAQRSRKWATHQGHSHINEGELLNVHKFIPQSGKAEKLNQLNNNLVNVPNLEKWFIRQVTEGQGRNNTLFKYAMVLADLRTMSEKAVLKAVVDLNNRLENPITETRIYSTIGISVAKRMAIPH
jgi:hypothetical protein